MKKILSLFLVFVMLLSCMAACGDDSERISSSGELGDDALKNFYVQVWKVGALKSGDAEALIEISDGVSFTDFKNELAKGIRLQSFMFDIKDVKELENKKLSKVSFTIEPTKDTTIVLAAMCGANKSTTPLTVSLSANTKKTVSIDFGGYADFAGKGIFISVGQTENDYKYGTAEFTEWSQTEYKITNFKVICE